MQQTTTRLSRILAFLWLRELFSRQPKHDTELVLWGGNSETMVAARAEVDALTPSTPQWDTDNLPRSALLPMFVVLLAGTATGTAALLGDGQHTRCTFADGSSVSGECMFVDEFNGAALDETAWRADDNWLGPIGNVAPELGCVRHENVSVSGGNLRLAMTNSSRSSCPQTWSTTAHYNTNYGNGWPINQPTSYDVSIVDMRTFKLKYGRVAVRALAPAGYGPSLAVILWGENCQPGGTIHNYVTGFFAQNGTCVFPQPGAREFDIPNYAHGNSDGADQIIATAYVGNDIGSPTLLRTFFGVPYYGSDWAVRPGIPNYKTFKSSAFVGGDPSVEWHVYETDWRPGYWAFYIDGIQVATDTASWIPSEFMYLMLWNVDELQPVAADLPQTALIDYVRIWCPPTVPCQWSQ